MSDSIADILAKGDRQQPDELQIIKDFVQERVGITPQISVSDKAFYVTIPNASAVATLRFEVFRLERKLNTPRKIILKIV